MEDTNRRLRAFREKGGGRYPENEMLEWAMQEVEAYEAAKVVHDRKIKKGWRQRRPCHVIVCDVIHDAVHTDAHELV